MRAGRHGLKRPSSKEINEKLAQPRDRADGARSKETLSRIPANRWGEPGGLEGAIVFLASRASDSLSGHVMAVDGGWCER